MLIQSTRLLPYLFGVVCLGLIASLGEAANIVEKATDTPKPLSPEQSAALFKLPKNIRIELVAAWPRSDCPERPGCLEWI